MDTSLWDWFEMGKDHDPKAVTKVIGMMEWQELPITTGMMQGEGIKVIIKEYKIPSPSHVAIDGLGPFGLYGIRAHYKNGSREIFFMDEGTHISPLCSRPA